MESIKDVFTFLLNHYDLVVTIVGTAVTMLGAQKYLLPDKYLKWLAKTEEYFEALATAAEKGQEFVQDVKDRVENEDGESNNEKSS